MPDEPLKVAAINTAYFPASHADVILSRWMVHRPQDAAWGWFGPRTKLVSVYVDQLPANDISIETCREHGIRHCASVEEALTLGSAKLAVDAVLLIGEHGDYPLNEHGQKLYPRKELFDQITTEFRKHGKAVPVFCDKHLSWNFSAARAMVATAEELEFSLTAGSSLPVCRLSPEISSVMNFPTREVVATYYENNEISGYHSMELVQSFIEHRLGGETGLRAVTAWKGDAAQRAMEEGKWCRSLMDSARRSVAPMPGHAASDMGSSEPVTPRAACVWEYLDGTRVTYVNLPGLNRGWSLAMRHRDTRSIQAATAVLGGKPTYYAQFATLCRVIEDRWLGAPPTFPVQRTLLVTGMVQRFMQALSQPGQRIETPELHLSYQSNLSLPWHAPGQSAVKACHTDQPESVSNGYSGRLR